MGRFRSPEEVRVDSQRTISRGAVAGLLAATAVVAFFFVVDLARGQPLETPTFLAATITGTVPAAVGMGTLLLYTGVHYAVFIGLGILVAAIVASLALSPGLIVGLLLGLVFFDLMFYSGLIVAGVDVIRALGWPLVLMGNLLAGLVMSGWLRRTSPEHVVSWGEILRRHRIVREAVYSGLLGAGAVAVWFLVFDLATRGALFTPGALGSALFYGARGPAEVQITATTVLGYTLIHVIGFIAVGFLAASLLVLSLREPSLLGAFMLIFVTLEAVLIGWLAVFATWILSSLGWWSVAVGNIVAAVVMGWYLWRAHPEVRTQLGASPDSLEREVPVSTH
jgi:hypothetical protein